MNHQLMPPLISYYENDLNVVRKKQSPLETYMQQMLLDFDLVDDDDMIIVEDNANFHQSKTTPCVCCGLDADEVQSLFRTRQMPQCLTSKFPALKKNLPNDYYSDRLTKKHMERDQQKQQPSHQWDPLSDSVVGFANKSKNRWGNSDPSSSSSDSSSRQQRHPDSQPPRNPATSSSKRRPSLTEGNHQQLQKGQDRGVSKTDSALRLPSRRISNTNTTSIALSSPQPHVGVEISKADSALRLPSRRISNTNTSRSALPSPQRPQGGVGVSKTDSALRLPSRRISNTNTTCQTKAGISKTDSALVLPSRRISNTNRTCSDMSLMPVSNSNRSNNKSPPKKAKSGDIGLVVPRRLPEHTNSFELHQRKFERRGAICTFGGRTQAMMAMMEAAKQVAASDDSSSENGDFDNDEDYDSYNCDENDNFHVLEQNCTAIPGNCASFSTSCDSDDRDNDDRDNDEDDLYNFNEEMVELSATAQEQMQVIQNALSAVDEAETSARRGAIISHVHQNLSYGNTRISFLSGIDFSDDDDDEDCDNNNSDTNDDAYSPTSPKKVVKQRLQVASDALKEVNEEYGSFRRGAVLLHKNTSEMTLPLIEDEELDCDNDCFNKKTVNDFHSCRYEGTRDSIMKPDKRTANRFSRFTRRQLAMFEEAITSVGKRTVVTEQRR